MLFVAIVSSCSTYLVFDSLAISFAPCPKLQPLSTPPPSAGDTPRVIVYVWVANVLLFDEATGEVFGKILSPVCPQDGSDCVL